MRQVARYIGVHPSTVSRWIKRAPRSLDGRLTIPTKSSRPQNSPNRIASEIEEMIIQERLRHGRCGQVIWHKLKQQGISIGLATVNRVLKRNHLIRRRSPWKRYHWTFKRPYAEKPGDLVQIDTLLDVFSRWGYAWAVEKINVKFSLIFVKQAHRLAPFDFQCLQSDHGSEFSQHFSERIKLKHRHSRVRTPNDNAHLERFNRTLKEECLRKIPRQITIINKVMREYLIYYNTERLHLGLNCQTPIQRINQVLQRC